MGMLSLRVRVKGWLSNNGDVEPTGKGNNYVGTQTMGMLSLRVSVIIMLVLKQWGC